MKLKTRESNMKKKIILVVMLLFTVVPVFAQTETSPKLIGVNGGIGLPFTCA
jgi:hypothetical protein